MKRKWVMYLMAALLLMPLATVGLTGCGGKQVQEQEGMDPNEAARLAEQERLRQQRLREMELARQAEEVFESEMVHFDYDRYDIRPDAAEVMDRKARFMSQHPGLYVEIQGHCDERGTEAYNMALGDRRAHAAKKYMMNKGIGNTRMTTVSYGEEMPLDPGHTEHAYAMNRRAQFVVVKR
jgi:peptidoglycan-associated lipoprotein